MRAWRNWTAQRRTSQRQCITPNAYSCLELNAHGLVLAARRCRDRGHPEQFLPNRFGSQDVEDTFRTLRSMTSMWHTQTNVTIRELSERLRRVQMFHVIEYRNKDTFRFPRRSGSGTEQCPYALPNDAEIKAAMEDARTSASDVLERLGLPKDMQSFECSIIATGDANWQDRLVDDDNDGDGDKDGDKNGDKDDDDDDETAGGAYERVYEAKDLIINFTGELRLRDSKSKKDTYLVRDHKGVHRVSRSSVIWALTRGRYRGTSARITRYSEKPVATATRRSQQGAVRKRKVGRPRKATT